LAHIKGFFNNLLDGETLLGVTGLKFPMFSESRRPTLECAR
jgi:hypothetical protein